MSHHSPEFLEELLKEAKKHLPKWLYASLLSSARARAGGRARHRTNYPSPIEKLALTEIRPPKLKELKDDDLSSIWARLHDWYATAKRKREAVEDIVNAALWVKQELGRRKVPVSASPLVEAVAELEAVSKERRESVRGKPGKIPDFLGECMKGAPDEITLVRDFMAIGGSAAVAEKPGDIDVVVRANYDAPAGAYQLDGSSMWVAVRRFLKTKKDGPPVQLLGSPAGSFTDYVPAYDLVLRRREPSVVKIEPTPPAYAGKQRVIKQARAATPAIRAQAERSKKSNRVTPGEFFFQPKPTRPAKPEEPQTIDGLVKLYEERAETWLPAWVQKKFDGARHQIHKDGAIVKIYSEDGDDNTDRLPGLVAAIEGLAPERLVLDAELDMWDDGKHLPRETVAGYLSAKSEPDDSAIVANVFDALYLGDRDIHELPLEERLKFLTRIGKGTEGVPDLNKRINVVPGHKAESPADIRSLTERIRKLPGSEGIVAKRLESPYTLSATTRDDWVKFHNATTIKGVVTGGKRTKGWVWVYEFAIRPGKERVLHRTKDGLTPVGKTFATGRKFSPGERILVEAETVNVVRGPEGVELTAWVPRVLGTFEGDPDTVEAAASRAADQLVLRSKRVDEKGEVIEYLPANILKSKGSAELSPAGPSRAPVAFVGASLDRIEKARGEHLVGSTGLCFRRKYLDPLGLEKSQVFLSAAVPQVLVGLDGRRRDPVAGEVEAWKAELEKCLDDAGPMTVVALGKVAAEALGDRADAVLPHPAAVDRRRDSGEVSRKLRRIRKLIGERSMVNKALPRKLEEGEGGTRSARAASSWEKNWYKFMPKSGTGKFSYQHHWRGLTDDEIGMTDADLMKNTDHSIHGDLRLEGHDGLWGFTAFLGETKDNRGPNLDKLIDWKPGDNIEASPKLNQPVEWLDVGREKPFVTGPGQVGSTAEKFSKFFLRDSGNYSLGVARKHMAEIFLDGRHLKGRYLLMFAPVAGQRRWLIDKPEDQTPMADTRDLADLTRELKRKNQRFLIWGKPGVRPRFINVQTGQVEKADPVPISKADTVKRIVFGVVMDPYSTNGPEPDGHNDWTSPAEIEKAAHRFSKGSRVIGVQHKRKADAVVVEESVEQYPSRKDYLAAIANKPHRVYRRKFGDDVIHSGAWILGVELGPAEWAAFERGELNAFSPGGVGVKTPITRAEMPRVTFVDLVEREAR